MGIVSPLAPRELQEIEEALELGEVSRAATLLGSIAGTSAEVGPAIDFLTTRILLQRGLISPAGAEERMGEVLRECPYFPEAETWLLQLKGQQPLGQANPLAESSQHSSNQPKGGGPAPDDEAVGESNRADAPRVGSQPAAGAPHSASASWSDAAPAVEAADDSQQPSTVQRPHRIELPHDEPLPQDEPRDTFEPAAFDSLRAKRRLESSAGRYRTTSELPPPETPEQLESVFAQIDEALVALEEGHKLPAESLVRHDWCSLLPQPYDSRFATLHLLLGNVSEALSLAESAVTKGPDSQEACLVYAWCLVRSSRLHGSPDALRTAKAMLSKLDRKSAVEPGLRESLEACVEARLGSPAIALQIAQRALRVKGDSLDALAALAEANAALGDLRRSDAALEQMLSYDGQPGRAFRARLHSLGAGEGAPASTAVHWHASENALRHGARPQALECLERMAQQFVDDTPGTPSTGASSRGVAAATWLRTSPVFRVFAAYAFHPNDVSAIDACLWSLYGDDPRPVQSVREMSLLTVVADYLAETLHRLTAAAWVEAATDETCALGCSTGCPTLQTTAGPINAHALVLHRVVHGRHSPLSTALQPVLERSSVAPTRPLAMSSAPPHAEPLKPRPPEGAARWPSLQDLIARGRSLSDSFISVYCEAHCGGPLDRSLGSLSALDAFLRLVAPSYGSVGSPERLLWLATLAGGYYGEVLCEAGGRWKPCGSPSPEGYIVQLDHHRICPVQVALDGLRVDTPQRLADDALAYTTG